MNEPQRTAAPERSKPPDTGEDGNRARAGLQAGLLGRLRADPDHATQRFVLAATPAVLGPQRDVRTVWSCLGFVDT